MSEDATLDEFVEAESESSEQEIEDLARKTVCGIPPQDWTVARLGELVRVVSGNSLPTEYQNGKEGEHPVYKVSDMNATGNQKYVSDTSNRLSKEDLEEINHTLYPDGTIILPKVGAALLTNKRRILTEPSSFDNNVMGWVPDEINPEFLYYVSCMIDMEAVAQKGAVPSISKAIAKSLKIPSPPPSEQRKIATVLYTVDRAIEKTEEIVEQSWRVKKGLVQNLLTEGVHEHSKFETYRLGPIDLTKPADWELKSFGEFSYKVQDGPHITPDYVDEGIPFVSSQNVRPFRENFDYSQYEKYISEEIYEDINQNCRPEKGDLIISRRATIGPTQLIRHNEQFGFFVGVAIIKTNDTVHNPFLEQLMNWSVMEKLWHLKSPGSTMKTLNLGTIKEQKIPLPSLQEQKAIAEILRSQDDVITNNERYKESLQRLKRGLQQDLLSGKVRTTNTNIEVPDEIAQHG